MTAHANNFLAPEPFIVERLQGALVDLTPKVSVFTAADLAGVKEQGQHVPAVHVVWTGFKVVEAPRTDGLVVKLRHTWLIVAVVRNVQNAKSGGAARDLAGELAAQAGAAVMGFRPPNVSTPMLMAPNTPPAYFRAGYMYLPLAFTVDSIFKAN